MNSGTPKPADSRRKRNQLLFWVATASLGLLLSACIVRFTGLLRLRQWQSKLAAQESSAAKRPYSLVSAGIQRDSLSPRSSESNADVVEFLNRWSVLQSWRDLPEPMRWEDSERAFAVSKQSNWRSRARSTNSWQQLASQLDTLQPKLRAFLKVVDDGRGLPDFRPRRPGIAARYCGITIQAARLLGANAVVGLHLEQPDRVREAIDGLCALDAALGNTGNPGALLARTTLSAYIFGSLWEALSGDKWTREDLRSWAARLEALDYLGAIQPNIRRDLETSSRFLSETRSSLTKSVQFAGRFAAIGAAAGATRRPSTVRTLLGPLVLISDQLRQAFHGALWITIWTYHDEANLYAFEEQLGTLAAKVREDGLPLSNLLAFGWRESNATIKNTWNRGRRSARLSLAAPLLDDVQRLAVNEIRRRLCLVAIALHSFRLTHGQFPNSLSELAPNFLNQIPKDLLTGEPMSYARQEGGTGFRLTSSGLGKRDDPNLSAIAGSTMGYVAEPAEMSWPSETPPRD